VLFHLILIHKNLTKRVSFILLTQITISPNIICLSFLDFTQSLSLLFSPYHKISNITPIIGITPRVGPPYKQVKHLLEVPKIFFKKIIAKKGPKFKKKKIPTCLNLKEFWNKEKGKKKMKNR
jgi:hypothetical protein